MMSNGATPTTQSTDKTAPVNETMQPAGKVQSIPKAKAATTPKTVITKKGKVHGTATVVTIGTKTTRRSPKGKEPEWDGRFGAGDPRGPGRVRVWWAQVGAVDVGVEGVFPPAVKVTAATALQTRPAEGFAVSETAPAKPFKEATVTVEVPELVARILAGVTAPRETVGGKPCATKSVKVAVLVMPPPVAEIVTVVNVSKGAVCDAIRVTVAKQVGLQLVGVNALADTPRGSGVVILNVTGVVAPARTVAVPVS